ncbi:3TM-type holin [Novosphingobium fluoreni]|uniref:3TM-type holin n=1 Tax=Novosphingobium fluoreni TaxID=1391222 RepID=UPI003DA0BD14
MSVFLRLILTMFRRMASRMPTSAAPLRSQALLDTAVPLPPLDIWTQRARPTFLYVMYAVILWSLPVGVIAAISPSVASAMTKGMTDYLARLPEPLYALFAAGYLGYAGLRQWGKVKGTDR